MTSNVGLPVANILEGWIFSRSRFSREWIQQLELLDPDHADSLSAQDRLIQKWALAIDRRSFSDARQLFDAVIEQLGHEKAVAALMVVGRYVAHSAMVQTLNLAPPVPSIFDDDFTGD